MVGAPLCSYEGWAWYHTDGNNCGGLLIDTDDLDLSIGQRLSALWTQMQPLRTVLVDLSLWGTSIIGLAVQCPDRKYFRSVRVPRNVYDQVLEFLKRNHGRTFREVMDAEIDISDVIQ
jgi:hypothetical protein